MRLVIGGPTRDTVPASFAMDLARLYDFTKAQGAWESVELGFVQSTYVHVGREDALRFALERQASHLLWLDTDMGFPMDAAIRLGRHHHHALVACNCVMRDPRLLFTAFRGSQRVETGPTSTGLEPVDSVGLAIALLRVDVVAELPRPWFRHQLNEHGGDIGEDVTFCRKLTAAGHQVMIDHDVSNDKQVKHIGLHGYQPSHHTALTV
jgi:hypothetical protein